MKKLNRYLKLVLFGIILAFILLHTTPKLAVRAYLIWNGHPLAAVTSQVVIKEQTAPTGEKILKGSIATDTAPVERATNTVLDSYTITHSLLYFAQYGAA